MVASGLMMIYRARFPIAIANVTVEFGGTDTCFQADEETLA